VRHQTKEGTGKGGGKGEKALRKTGDVVQNLGTVGPPLANERRGLKMKGGVVKGPANTT